MSRPLSDVLEVIDRSIFKAIDDKLVLEGYSVDRSITGILEDENAWRAQEQLIIADKGFVVELFGLSNNHEKLEKKFPRIVYIPQRLMPGDIGNSPAYRYQFDTSGGVYDRLIDPNQTSEYQFKIGLHAVDAKQFRILHAIVASSIPHRQYVPLYDDNTQQVLILQYSYQDDPDYRKGTLDGYYMYKVVDLFEHSADTIDTVPPITEIDLQIPDSSL